MRPAPDFTPLNDYFDQIVVITLERAGERRRRLQERLRGLDYRFHFGVDWRERDAAREGYDDRVARQVSRFGRPMSKEAEHGHTTGPAGRRLPAPSRQRLLPPTPGRGLVVAGDSSGAP